MPIIAILFITKHLLLSTQ